MEKTRFYKLGIILSIISFGLQVFAMPIESIVVAVISLVINYKHKEEYRIKIGMVVSILSILCATAFLAFLLFTEISGGANNSYWLCKLIRK